MTEWPDIPAAPADEEDMTTRHDDPWTLAAHEPYDPELSIPVPVDDLDLGDEWYPVYVQCGMCAGRGRVEIKGSGEFQVCDECGGRGDIQIKGDRHGE